MPSSLWPKSPDAAAAENEYLMYEEKRRPAPPLSVAGALDYAWLSWDYQTNGFAEYEVPASTGMYWHGLPADGFSAYTTDPTVLLPATYDDPAGDPFEAVSLLHQPYDGLPKLLHTSAWIAWASNSSYYWGWEYSSGSSIPANAPNQRYFQDESYGNLTVISGGEPGDLVMYLENTSGGPEGLISIGLYACVLAVHDDTGTSYPPWVF